MCDTKKTLINNGILLEEYSDGLLFGTDALLLSRFVRGGAKQTGVDIGTGCGSISLLLLSENKAAKMLGIEIQQRYYELSIKNAINNNYGERFECVLGDAKLPKELLEAECADFVVSNPPFMKSGGKQNDNLSKAIARHEEFLPIESLCKAAAYYLKYGGSFYVVYRPERVCTLITALSNNKLEPKRIEFVYGGTKNVASLVLIEAKKGGSEGCIVSTSTL